MHGHAALKTFGICKLATNRHENVTECKLIAVSQI